MTVQPTRPILPTGPITSHFCGMIIPQIFGQGRDRRMWVLTVEYFQMADELRMVRGNNLIKLPGGNGEDGELIPETRDRELVDEVLAPDCELEFDDAASVFVKDCHDQTHPGGVHRKQFWLIINLLWKGRLRDEPRREPDGNVLGQPFWRLMKDVLVENAMHKGHQMALRAAIDALAKNSDMYSILRADLLVP